jgi:hypothetical protein
MVSPATSRFGLGGAATGKKEMFLMRNGVVKKDGLLAKPLKNDWVLWKRQHWAGTRRPGFLAQQCWTMGP